jgi:hypothetical protein
MLSLAGARIELAQAEGTPLEEVFAKIEADIEGAVELDFYNIEVRRQVVTLYQNLGLDDRAREHQQEIFCWGVWECVDGVRVNVP